VKLKVTTACIAAFCPDDAHDFNFGFVRCLYAEDYPLKILEPVTQLSRRSVRKFKYQAMENNSILIFVLPVCQLRR
jgi:hypothetical protein